MLAKNESIRLEISDMKHIFDESDCLANFNNFKYK